MNSITDDIQILLVSCSLEETRHKALENVINSLNKLVDLKSQTNIIAFDNNSSIKETQSLLKNSFSKVFYSNKNVGLWTAINWWLNVYLNNVYCKYVYVIESDMIHYDLKSLNICADYLENNENIGSFRLHEYSILNKNKYDKSKSNDPNILRQNHTNILTNKRIYFKPTLVENIYETNFNPQLPGLNRYDIMKKCFHELSKMKSFNEHSFWKEYYKYFQINAILDNGIFHCNHTNLKYVKCSYDYGKFEYQKTRESSIFKDDEYTINLL